MSRGENQNGTGPMHNDPLLSFDFIASLPIVASPEPTPRTILLVDDDAEIRSLIRTFLEHEGYRVLSCGESERATQIFRTAVEHAAPIDLLITDFYIPQQTGMELAAKLKLLRRDLPVLLITGGFLGAGPLDRLREEGWHFLGKPFALPDLLAAVHLILGSDAEVAKL